MILYLPAKMWLMTAKFYWFTPAREDRNRKENTDVFTEYANSLINIMETGSNRKLRKVIACLFSTDLFI